MAVERCRMDEDGSGSVLDWDNLVLYYANRKMVCYDLTGVKEFHYSNV